MSCMADLLMDLLPFFKHVPHVVVAFGRYVEFKITD